MKKKYICLALAAAMVVGMLAGCSNTEGNPKQTESPVTDNKATEEPLSDEPVTLKIAGSWEDCIAVDVIGRSFTEKYPNCTVEYEYLQKFYPSLVKRMTGEDTIDIFFATNIQSDSEMLPYALDLNSRDDLDLSETFDGLSENFTFRGDDTNSDKLYAIPVGAEMRGMYINKTLLDSLNIDIPTDQASLLAACEKLKNNGYIPMQGNPGDFAQTLMYPWICNIVANAEDYQAVYDRINAREPGLSELFSEPFEFLYTLVENYYYDYKTAQGIKFDMVSEDEYKGLFSDSTDEAYARYFFNIRQNGDTYEKIDDIGQVAFLSSSLARQNIIEKTKDDYHSKIEYVFVPAPTGKEGGFVYLSPARAIAVNKNSENLDWSVRFMDFLFKPENNELFAKEFNVIPNTKKSFNYVHELYDISDDRISHLGEVTFDYGFYEIISASLLEISKGNNPKYMNAAEDGSVSLYPLEYYMNKLEESFNEKE